MATSNTYMLQQDGTWIEPRTTTSPGCGIIAKWIILPKLFYENKDTWFDKCFPYLFIVWQLVLVGLGYFMAVYVK